MVHCFTRQEFYDLVWSEPVKKIAPRLGISHVGLAKACRRSDVPVPELGYWSRLRAGKTVMKRPLPPRGLGMSETVEIGDRSSETSEALRTRLLTESVPPPPIFSEEMSLITERVRKMVDDVSVPKTLERPHSVIARLLSEDGLRRQRKRILDEVLFDSRCERRRLRILNALFLALQRCGCRPWIRDKRAREIGVEVGQTSVSFSLDPVAGRGHVSHRASPPDAKAAARERLRLALTPLWRVKTTERSWEDTESLQIEDQLGAITVELIAAGEAYYRAGTHAQYEWRLERKAELQEEARRRKEEQERHERERLAKLEGERLERLFNAANNWRRAVDLRAFVETVREANRGIGDAASTERLERWAADALAAADRLDPIQAGQLRFDGEENRR